MVTREILKELNGLAPRRHAMLLYDTRERKEDVLFTQLKRAGRLNVSVYVCSEESPREAEASMKRFGIDVERRKKNGTLVIKNYDQVYIVNEKVDSPAIVKGFSDLAYHYSSIGYGMRTATEMSCFFRTKKVHELVNYEKDLHRKFSFPAHAICGYNLFDMYNSHSIDVLWPIMRAHGTVIMTGPGGSFALPPEEVRAKDIEKTMATPGSIEESKMGATLTMSCEWCGQPAVRRDPQICAECSYKYWLKSGEIPYSPRERVGSSVYSR